MHLSCKHNTLCHKITLCDMTTPGLVVEHISGRRYRFLW